MNNPAFPHGLDRTLPSRRVFPRAQGARKKLPRFMPRNSLKSLDSDEKIQGNQRKGAYVNRRLTKVSLFMKPRGRVMENT
jgi:hypothetical protein